MDDKEYFKQRDKKSEEINDFLKEIRRQDKEKEKVEHG